MEFLSEISSFGNSPYHISYFSYEYMIRDTSSETLSVFHDAFPDISGKIANEGVDLLASLTQELEYLIRS